MKISLSLILILLLSCQVPTKKRMPSSENLDLINNELLLSLYSSESELNQLKREEQTLKDLLFKQREQEAPEASETQRALEIFSEKLKLKVQERVKLESDIASTIAQSGEPLPSSQSFDFTSAWRTQIEKLAILNPNNYALADGKIVREFAMDLHDAREYKLGIFHLPNSAVTKSSKLAAKLRCDASFEIKKGIAYKMVQKGQYTHFELKAKDDRTPQVVIKMGKDISECELLFSTAADPKTKYGVRLVKETENQIAELRKKAESCYMPSTENLKGIEKFFLTPDYRSMTCAMTLENEDMQTLENPIDGLKAKAEALLGMPIPKEIITSRNPFMEFDFSRAPKLDTILISYLVFRADFYGTLLSRLVKWHADRGTQVRILVSNVITLDKDHEMLYGLQESSNNIKLQEYRYDSSDVSGGLFDALHQFHRTMHVKLFITLGPNPKDSMVVFGGRNIHDGFIFKDVPDYSALPKLVQYGKGKDENYAHWRDFEVQVRSAFLAKKIASHYLTLWDRDSKNFDMRSINQNINIQRKADPAYFESENQALIRHLISVPYKDDEMLEKFYVKLIDSAEHSLRLSTPYFHLTKTLGKAMERAVLRGVDVSVITRIDLKGDTADVILSEVNKGTINKFLKKIKIYEYTVPSEILHSKLVLIDDKFSFVGSVNLNKRSFIHDMENGIMVYSKEYNQKMNKIMDTYQVTSREVNEKQKLSLWKQIVVGIFSSAL